MIFFGLNLMPPQASTVAPAVDRIYTFLVAVSVFFTLLIFTLIVVFAVRYHRRFVKEKPKAIEGHNVLETIWIVIPLVIVMIAFVWGAVVYFNMFRVPKDGLEIFTVGKQWMWKFQHPNGNREINELHVPVGRTVKMTITSEDLIHSFYVPAFRVKMDAIPGRYTTAWFEATLPGKYHLFCAEYCGKSHSLMGGWVYVMKPQDYERWLLGGEGIPAVTTAARGEKLFEEMGCVTCHRAGPTMLGPSLEGIFGEDMTMEDGETVHVDEAYLRESILTPGKRLVKGYMNVMPTYEPLLNETQILEIISYIKSLTEET